MAEDGAIRLASGEDSLWADPVLRPQFIDHIGVVGFETARLIRSGRLRLVLLQEIRLGVDEPKPRDMGEVARIGRSDIKPIVQGGSRDE